MQDSHANQIVIVIAGMLLGLTCASVALSQERPLDLLSSELQGELTNIYNGGLTGLHIFSSTDSVSSGFFSVKKDDGSEKKFEVMKAGADIPLADKDSVFVPFVSGMIGIMKLTDSPKPVEGEGQDDFSRISTLSIGVGGGVDIHLLDQLRIVPKLMAVYGHTENRFDYHNTFSQEVLQVFDRELFNWDIDTMTYLPSVKSYYVWDIGATQITPSVNYTHIYVDSFSSSSPLVDVDSNSGLLQTRLSLDHDLGLLFVGAPLRGELFGQRNDIYGKAADGLGFNNYHEAGFLISANTENKIPLFASLGLGVSYAWNSDFDGWRIGLQGDF